MTTLNLQVTANTDDCNRRLTTSYWNLSAVYVAAGYNGATNKQWGSGMRFTSVTIPKGSPITEAHLTLHCVSSYSGETVNSRISAEDVDDAVTFADDSAAFDTRWAARTTARVDWNDIPGWTADTNYDSPDIKTVIQEIVNRAGWASGQDIVIFWDDFDDRSGIDEFSARDADSYEGSATYAPKLVITYTPADTPTVTTQAVTNIVTTTATGNGNVTSLGNSDVTQHGHCWNTTGTPTTSSSKTTNGAAAATGAFTSSLTGLTVATKYYVRAYATNSADTSYGEQVIFIAGAPGGELRGNYAVVEERFHYVDAYGVERYVQGTVVP